MNLDHLMNTQLVQREYPGGRVESPFGDDFDNHVFLEREDMAAFIEEMIQNGDGRNVKSHRGPGTHGEVIAAHFDLNGEALVLIFMPAIQCGWVWRREAWKQAVADCEKQMRLSECLLTKRKAYSQRVGALA